MAQRKFITAARLKISGRFVPKSRAKSSPKTTITSRLPIGRSRKKK